MNHAGMINVGKDHTNKDWETQQGLFDKKGKNPATWKVLYRKDELKKNNMGILMLWRQEGFADLKITFKKGPGYFGPGAEENIYLQIFA